MKFRRLFSRRPQKRHILIVAGLLFVTATPVFAATNFAQDLYQFLSNIVILAVQTVGNLTALATHILIVVSSYGTDGVSGFTNTAVVKTGWSLIRDITNMFFIVALLMIAAGTILRIENYRYNRLLARVIIMAFLVNYSRLIAGFLIQTSQVVMLTFVNSYKDALFGNFASMFGLTDVLTFASKGTGALQGVQDYGVILMSLTVGLGLMVAALVVTLAMVVILIVRIVALWILVILSPAAYALRVLPNTEKYASQWWSEFGRYVTVGPVLAFFLWLALALVVSTNANTLGSIADQAQKYQNDLTVPISQDFASKIMSLENLSAFMFAIIFMIIALKYATGSGVVGARLAGQFGTGVGLWATRMNYLQDRTIRPIQGWWSARQSRGKEAVSRRSRSLLQQTDRLESTAIGRPARLIQGVAQGVQSAAGQGLRQTGQVGGGLLKAGYGVLKTRAQVMQKSITPEQATAQRAAARATALGALEQAKQAPKTILGEAGLAGGVTAGLAVGTDAERRRQAEMRRYEHERREQRQKITPAENYSPEQRRAIVLARAGKKDDRMLVAGVMARNREIDMQEKDPLKLQQNEEIAAEYGEDIRRHSTSQAEISRSIENIDPEVVEHMFKQFGTPEKFNPQNQLLLSSIGRFAEAFGGATDEAARHIENNSRRVKELIKKGLVSSASIDPDKYKEVIKKIHDLPGIGDEDWTEGLKHNKTLAASYYQMGAQLAPEMNAKGKEGFDEKWMGVVREVAGQANKGGEMTIKNEQGEEVKENVFDVMYRRGTENLEGEDKKAATNALDQVIRANGKEFWKFDFDKASPEVQESFRNNVSVGALSSLLEKNTGLVDQVFERWERIYDGIDKVDDSVARAVRSRVKRSRSNDLLAGYAAKFKNLDDNNDEDDGRTRRQPNPPPQTPPGNPPANRAEREASQAQPARPGSRIVTPPGTGYSGPRT